MSEQRDKHSSYTQSFVAETSRRFTAAPETHFLLHKEIKLIRKFFQMTNVKQVLATSFKKYL